MYFYNLVVCTMTLFVCCSKELMVVSSLKEIGVGVCNKKLQNGSTHLYCCPGFTDRGKNDACEACSLGTFGTNCDNSCKEGYYGAGCNSSCDCPIEICDWKYGCTLKSPEGRKIKDNTGVIIGCVVILLLILTVTVLLVLWKTGRNTTFIRMNINRARSFFQRHSNSFEVTTNDNYYASIRVSAVVDNYRPSAMHTHSIQLLRQTITNQHDPFREGNHTSTRSNLDIYSVASPLRNTSSLDGEVLICNTSCANPERVVPTLSDPSQENEEVTHQENEDVIQCDNYSFLVNVEESLNELNKDSTC